MATAEEEFEKADRYFSAGQFSLAEQFSLAVLKSAPNHAKAFHLLGVIAWQKGDLGLAFDYLKRSLVCDETVAAHWVTLGNVYTAAGNSRESIPYYEQALRLRPDYFEAHKNLGVTLLILQDWEKAAENFRAAIRITPTVGSAYNYLGSALRGQGKLFEALNAFKQALCLQSDNAEIAYNLGLTFYDLRELDQAVDYYRQALRLQPAFILASNNLADALKEQGLLDEAIAQFRETLKLQPDNAFAYYSLSEFTAEGRFQFQPKEMERLRTFLASGRWSDADRNLGSFALARVLHKQGSYEEAFGYFQKGNELKKRFLQERNLAFDPQIHDALIDRIIAAYGRSYFERVKKWGLATDQPIFIIGMPRSGSTLVEQILASHPQVFGAGEIDDIYRFVINGEPRKKTELYTTPLLPNLRVARKKSADYIKFLAGLAPQGKARVTIKTNENFLHLGLIATLFPRARIVHCRRDPLDICLSCYFQNFRSADFVWSLEDIGTYYRAYHKVMAHWSRVLPLEIHELCYEDLIQNQERVIRGLLDFCGLDWDERCLSFYNTRRVVLTASTVQVRKPISSRAVGRWKHYRAHLGPLFKALGLDPSKI